MSLTTLETFNKKYSKVKEVFSLDFYKIILDIQNSLNTDNKTQINTNTQTELYEYCKLDTLAMVEIHKYLLKI